MSLINLEDGFSGPSNFPTSGAPQTQKVSVGATDVTLQGGVFLSNETRLPADETTVYGTGYIDPNLAPYMITISFSTNVTNVVFNLYNGTPTQEAYNIIGSNGNVQQVTIPPNSENGENIVYVPGSVDKVIIAPVSGTQPDYSINRIQFNFDLAGTLNNPKSALGKSYTNFENAFAIGCSAIALLTPPITLLAAGLEVIGMADLDFKLAIQSDPPDPNYKEEYFPSFQSLPQITASSSIPQNIADDANAAFVYGSHMVADSNAISVSANRLSSAAQANDSASVQLQNLAAQSYVSLDAQAMDAYSKGLIKLAADLDAAHIDFNVKSSDFTNFQNSVKANGLAALPHGETQVLEGFGLTPGDEQSLVANISTANLGQANLSMSFISSILQESANYKAQAALYDPTSIEIPKGSENQYPEITQTSTFQQNGLTYFKLNYSDLNPNATVVGFGFKGINGSGWAPDEQLFTSPSYGIVSSGKASDGTSSGQVEYPFNLGSPSTPSYVAAYVFDSVGNSSPEVPIHLT